VPKEDPVPSKAGRVFVYLNDGIVAAQAARADFLAEPSDPGPSRIGGTGLHPGRCQHDVITSNRRLAWDPTRAAENTRCRSPCQPDHS